MNWKAMPTGTILFRRLASIVYTIMHQLMFSNFSLKNQLSDKEKLGGKLDEDEQSKIEEVINEKIKWLEENTVST